MMTLRFAQLRSQGPGLFLNRRVRMSPMAVESERKVARLVAYAAGALFFTLLGLQAWALG